jgi:hypothetical protein
MKFNTKRYTIRNVEGQGFNEGIKYEINLKDGYKFSDDSHLDYAENVEELRDLIADIEEEEIKNV